MKPLTYNGVDMKHLTLPNNIEFMLVSDPELDKAGASVDVKVGSLSDPEGVPGLAHFLGAVRHAHVKFVTKTVYCYAISSCLG